MIYFDENKNAYAFEIKDCIATIDDASWQQYAMTDKWDIIDGKFVDITNTEEYRERKEKEDRKRINLLSMTKREMFLGLYQAKQITPDMLKAQITDPQALIEFEYANDYYRGNPLIDIIGGQLVFTTEQLDKFFKTKDYTYLLPSEPANEEKGIE